MACNLLCIAVSKYQTNTILESGHATSLAWDASITGEKPKCWYAVEGRIHGPSSAAHLVAAV